MGVALLLGRIPIPGRMEVGHQCPSFGRVWTGYMDRLTSAQFEALLQTLHPDRDLAGSEYEKIRRKLVNYFHWNSCVSAGELADETLDRVAQKIQREQIDNLSAFIWGIARRVLQEAKKKAARSAGSLEVHRRHALQAAAQQAMDDQLEIDRRLKCFEGCLLSLPAEDQVLFRAYYEPGKADFKTRQKLAMDMGISLSALRVRINRIRERLEKCTKKCITSE